MGLLQKQIDRSKSYPFAPSSVQRKITAGMKREYITPVRYYLQS
jgi:hypothetical protein